MAVWTSRCGNSTRDGGSASSPTAPIPSTWNRSSRSSSITSQARRRILDVGCGEGQIARKVAGAATFVVGVDPTAAQIVEARDEAADRSTPAPTPTTFHIQTAPSTRS